MKFHLLRLRIKDAYAYDRSLCGELVTGENATWAHWALTPKWRGHNVCADCVRLWRRFGDNTDCVAEDVEVWEYGG